MSEKVSQGCVTKCVCVGGGGVSKDVCERKCIRWREVMCERLCVTFKSWSIHQASFSFRFVSRTTSIAIPDGLIFAISSGRPPKKALARMDMLNMLLWLRLNSSPSLFGLSSSSSSMLNRRRAGAGLGPEPEIGSGFGLNGLRDILICCR